MTSGPAYAIDDPRPLAAEAPYTFFLPSPEEVVALAPGDMAKLIFRPADDGRKWGAERMWVQIIEVDGERFEGRLENEPDDIPGLSLGDPVAFQAFQVIDCWWDEARAEPPPPSPPRREYLERCMVDDCVLFDGAAVHYLYREEPGLGEESDRYPDSGWRIRGDFRGVSDEEMADRDPEYVALGAVLNHDDSWLHLIDAPIGSAFIRDWDSGQFVPQRRDP